MAVYNTNKNDTENEVKKEMVEKKETLVDTDEERIGKKTALLYFGTLYGKRYKNLTVKEFEGIKNKDVTIDEIMKKKDKEKAERKANKKEAA